MSVDSQLWVVESLFILCFQTVVKFQRCTLVETSAMCMSIVCTPVCLAVPWLSVLVTFSCLLAVAWLHICTGHLTGAGLLGSMCQRAQAQWQTLHFTGVTEAYVSCMGVDVIRYRSASLDTCGHTVNHGAGCSSYVTVCGWAETLRHLVWFSACYPLTVVDRVQVTSSMFRSVDGEISHQA